jgi:hypothetical protein
MQLKRVEICGGLAGLFFPYYVLEAVSNASKLGFHPFTNSILVFSYNVLESV